MLSAELLTCCTSCLKTNVDNATVHKHVVVAMTLFRTHGRVQTRLALGSREQITTKIWCPMSHLTALVWRHGRGTLWASGDPGMIGCLE